MPKLQTPSLRFILVLFAVSFAVRLLVSHASGTLTLHPESYTIRIVGGEIHVPSGSTPATQPLGNIYASALLFRLAAGNETLFGILLCLVGSFIPIMVVSLAALLLPPGGGRRNLLAGGMAAFFPPLVLLSATWRYMLVPVVLALLHLTCSLRKPGRSWGWGLSTGASGLALLVTRPDYYLAGALVALAQQTRWITRLAVVLVPLFLAGLHTRMVVGDVSPWGGSPYPWCNFDQGNHVHARDALMGYADIETVWAEDFVTHPAPKTSPGHECRTRVLRFISSHPQLFVENLFMKFARVFDVRRDNVLMQGPAENMTHTGSLLFTLLLALTGFGLLLGDPSNSGYGRRIVCAFIGFVIPWTLAFSVERMRIPFHVLWIALSAHTLDHIWGRWRAKKPPPPPAA